MMVLLHGVIVDGPVLADVEGAITATFTCAESTRGGSPALLPACCDVVCRGAGSCATRIGHAASGICF